MFWGLRNPWSTSMATEVKLPELGENLSGGDVLDVKVAAGEEVSQGQTLLELEAEKSTVEVPAPAWPRRAGPLGLQRAP